MTDDSWSASDVQVVCRQFGYPKEGYITGSLDTPKKVILHVLATT